MQIVIDIPDDFYERVNKDGCMSYTDAEVVVNAFYLGAVLPKGHGRLIDADVLKKKAVICPTVGNAETILLDIGDVEHAQTIIEADKGVDDADSN